MNQTYMKEKKIFPLVMSMAEGRCFDPAQFFDIRIL